MSAFNIQIHISSTDFNHDGLVSLVQHSKSILGILFRRTSSYGTHYRQLVAQLASKYFANRKSCKFAEYVITCHVQSRLSQMHVLGYSIHHFVNLGYVKRVSSDEGRRKRI